MRFSSEAHLLPVDYRTRGAGQKQADGICISETRTKR
jgi:hypothetical protein